MTKPRREVYTILTKEKSHPTAHEIFIQLQDRLPGVSLATIYNVLEALTAHHLVRQVNFEREPSRYCSNQVDHGHFHDLGSGRIHDIPFKKGVRPEDFLDLPPDVEISSLELTLRGQLTNPESLQKKTT